MTTLATDLSASEPGITTDDASKRLQSALVGNHEAVRIFGISLSETAMKQELFNMGIKDGASKATELEKATARLNLIMRGSKDAQGAASRASGDLRQQMGGFSSVFTETSARIGTIFAPALAQIVGFFKEMGSEINKAIGPSDRWGATLAEATKNVLATFKDVKQTVVDVSQGFASFTSSMSNGLLKATTDWSTFSDSMGKVFDHAIVMLKPFMLRIQDGVQQSFAGIAGALMGVFGAAESTIKGVIDSILAAMQDVIESIEKAINLTAVLNPMTVARRIERGAEHSRNDYSMNRDSRVSHFKREFHEAVAKDPLRGMWSMQQSDKGVSVNKQAERYARANEETEHRKKANAIDKKYGVDEYGNPLKNSEASRSVSEAREKMKGSSETIGEWMAEASKKMQAGFKNAFDHYGKNSPLSGAIDQAEEAKTKAGVIAKDKGIIGWIDDLLVKGKSLARSVGEDANEIGGKLSGMAEIEADKKDKIEKAKDPYEKYLADNANKPMQYSSSEDLGKKMQAAFDNNDGAALQLKAQQAIQLATTEANRKIQTLAADIGRVVNKSMAWGE